MERRLKERITGAFVLMLLAIIFIPMILDNSAQEDARITGTNIPAAPDVDFRSAVVPVDELPTLPPPPMAVEPLASGLEPAGATPPADGGLTAVETVPATDPVPTSLPAPTTSNPEPDPPADENAGPTNPVETAAPATDTASRSLSAWVIQLGSFSSQENAGALVRRLQSNGFPAYIEPVRTETETVYKVRVGPELSRTEAETVQKNLKSRMNLDAIILRFP